MRLSDRLPVYSFLSTKDILTKVMKLANQDRNHILQSSAILRKGRHGVLKLPKFDSVKTEREAYY